MANTIKMQALRDSVKQMRAAVNHMDARQGTAADAIEAAKEITFRTAKSVSR